MIERFSVSLHFLHGNFSGFLVNFGERDHTDEQFSDPRKKARAMMAR